MWSLKQSYGKQLKTGSSLPLAPRRLLKLLEMLQNSGNYLAYTTQSLLWPNGSHERRQEMPHLAFVRFHSRMQWNHVSPESTCTDHADGLSMVPPKYCKENILYLRPCKKPKTSIQYRSAPSDIPFLTCWMHCLCLNFRTHSVVSLWCCFIV